MAKSRSSSGSGTDALEEALDEVYLGNFEGFVTRRNELAKLLRAQGSGEAAERVRALKKPSRVAWAVNQLSARDAALRDGLLDAGAALRRAHERLVGGEAGQGGEPRSSRRPRPRPRPVSSSAAIATPRRRWRPRVGAPRKRNGI